MPATPIAARAPMMPPAMAPPFADAELGAGGGEDGDAEGGGGKRVLVPVADGDCTGVIEAAADDDGVADMDGEAEGDVDGDVVDEPVGDWVDDGDGESAPGDADADGEKLCDTAPGDTEADADCDGESAGAWQGSALTQVALPLQFSWSSLLPSVL